MADHKFLTPLSVEFIDGKTWMVDEPFLYQVNEDEIVSIPVGFLTDFASIPRGLWNIFPPTGKYAPAAVVHDWLYQKRTVVNVETSESRFVKRGEADHILRQAMEPLGVGRAARWTIYMGIRPSGWVAWRRYRSQEQRS